MNMSRMFFILSIILIIFTSCTQQEKKSNAKSDLSIFKEAYDKAAASDVVLDTIFLGLRFGMNKEEMHNHLREMAYKGKLEANNIDGYQYLLATDKNSILRASLSADFFEEKLYKFTLSFQDYRSNGIPIPVDEKYMVNRAKSLFVMKYPINKDNFNGYYYTLEGIGLFSCFIKKNMVVEFNPLGSMSYINAPIEKRKDASDKKKKQEKIKESISDL